MKTGALVVRKNMWGIDSRSIGLVIGVGKSPVTDKEVDVEVWQVLWSSKGSYEIRDHFADALTEINDTVKEVEE